MSWWTPTVEASLIAMLQALVILLGGLTLFALGFAWCPEVGTRLLLRLVTGECCKKASPVNSKDYNKLLDTEYLSYGKKTPVREAAKNMGMLGRGSPGGGAPLARRPRSDRSSRLCSRRGSRARAAARRAASARPAPRSRSA